MELTTKCFEGEDWSEVTLEEFLNCDHNLAFNRQTRMLADLSLVGCYKNIFNLTETHLDRQFITTFPNEDQTPAFRVMLESAKENLSKMRWFGLVEYQQASQYLFEGAFYPLHFIEPFSKWNSTNGDNALR